MTLQSRKPNNAPIALTSDLPSKVPMFLPCFTPHSPVFFLVITPPNKFLQASISVNLSILGTPTKILGTTAALQTDFPGGFWYWTKHIAIGVPLVLVSRVILTPDMQ